MNVTRSQPDRFWARPVVTVPVPGERLISHLRRDTWRLRFDGELESEFREYRVEQSIPLLRLSMVLAVGLYLSFLLLDWFTWQRFQEPWVYFLLWGLGLPSALGLLGFTYLRAAPRWLPQATRLVIIANAGTLGAAIVLGHLHAMQVPSQILIVHLLYNFFLTGLLLRTALPIALGTVGAYLLASFWTLDAHVRLFDDAFFLVATLLLGGIASYVGERTARRAWLQSRLLNEVAQHDGLTSLLNRRSFLEKAATHLAHAAREGRPSALLLVDADHFKSINDGFGHLAGDECLRRIAAHLAQAARRPLDLCARLGGEEFALLFYDTNLHWAMHRAQNLRQSISGTEVEVDGLKLRVTISIGIAIREPADRHSVEDLVRIADRSLYQAKAAGRDRVCVNS